MANTSRKRAPKGTKAQPIPFPQLQETQVAESSAAVAVEEPPATEDTTVQESDAKKTGPKPKDGMNFFERLRTFPATDWTNGLLVIYLYRFQPITDRLQGGNKAVFVMKYTSPIDENNVLMDHGSGVYHFKLNRSEDGQPRSAPIIHTTLEIVNKNFPPKIPAGEWVEDPRNKKWAWAAPKGSIFHQDSQAQPAGPAPLDPMSAFDTFTAMQDRIEERMQRDNPDPAAQATAAVTLVEKVLALTPKPAETKADDGMSKFVLAQITGMQAELAAARVRQDALMDKLIEANKAPAKSDGLGTLKEIIGTVKDFLPTIKEFLPEGGVSASVVRREKEPWWTGIAQTAIEAVQPAIPVIAHGIMQFANRPKTDAPKPAANGQPAVTVTATPVPAVSEPDIWDLLYNALAGDASGEDFAESVIMLFGEMRYKQACMFGESGLLSMIQNHAVWQRLGPFQDRMPQFIKEFVAYGKDEEEETGEEPGVDDPAELEVSNENAAAIEL